MLSHIRCDDRIVKLAVHFFDNVHGSHMAVVLHGERVLCLPLPDPLQPFSSLTRFYILVHLSGRFQGIRYDRHMHMDVPRDGCCVNINVYDLRIRSKCVELSRDTVIEPGPDGEEQDALPDRHVRRILPVHTKIADKQRMVRRDRSPSHDRRHDRHVRLFHDFRKHLVRTSDIDAAPCEE